MKEILYILLDNYAEHEIGFMPGAVRAVRSALPLATNGTQEIVWMAES